MALWSGQGTAFWSNRNSDGNPIQWNWFGNVPEFVLGLATETLTHKESYTGNRTTDARIITELTATVAITTDDFKEANMELATYGIGSQVASGSVVAEVVYDGTPQVGERYALNTTGRVTGAVLSHSGGAINTTFYTVDESGVIVFTDVTGLTGPITASYSKAAARQVGVFKTSAPEVQIRLDGLNTATPTSTGDFQRTIVDVFKTRLDPAENFGLINDEFGTLVLNGSALTDTTKAAASATGQFARFIYLDPPSQAVASVSASPSLSPSASVSISPSASASPSV